MSSTNKTATIELSQYVGTDKPTYLVDYNGDMLKIDNAIASDRDSITTAQNTADGAVVKADANKNSIDVINTQLNGDPEVPGDAGLSGDVNAIEGVVNTVTSLIGTGSPTTSEQTIIGAINGMEAAIAPREDGLLMANNYAIGDQFARGGTVYEALQSITTGTAFASLVLNTDYKVADTLVEQIANAASGALPTGKYIKAFNSTVSVTADGTKSYRDLFKELADALLSAADLLAGGEVMQLKGIDFGTYSAWGAIPIVLSFPPTLTLNNASSAINCPCEFTTVSAADGSVKIANIDLKSTGVSGYIYLTFTKITSSSPYVDVSEIGGNIPTSGTFTAYYDVVASFE